MSKQQRDRILVSGEELLRSWGLTPSSPVELFASCLGRASASDAAIAHWLGGRPTPESVELLKQLAASARDKIVRREARRALYRLQQRGMASPPVSQEVVARPLWQAEAPKTQAFFLPYLLGGHREFVLRRKRPGRVAVLFATTRQYDRFLEEVVRADLSGKEWQRLVASVGERGRVLVEGDAAYCDSLLWRAYENLPANERTAARDYPAVRGEFFDAPPATERASPLLELYPYEAVEKPASKASELAERLSAESAFLVLVADAREPLRPYVEQLRAVEASPLVLSEAQKQQRRQQIEDQAIDHVFAETERESWAHRLRELGYYFHLVGKHELARELARAAFALEKPESDPKRIPFCRALVLVGLFAELYQIEREEAEKARGSLVVTPEQLRRVKGRRPQER